MRIERLLLILGVGVALSAGCSDKSDNQMTNTGGGQYNCQTACNHWVNVCGTDWQNVEECVGDCTNEPWEQNYIECKSRTCEGDSVCEEWVIGQPGR
jgi:hypothetical protein